MNIYIDDTNVKAYATKEDIKKLCEEAIEHHFASVCVNPCYVELARELFKNSTVAVTTVVGFPLGANTTMVKSYEAIAAIEAGADEIDMVINIGALKDKDYEYVKNEIEEIRDSIDGHILKVIIETCYLTEEEIIKMTQICNETFVHFIKTSTGFGSRGASLEDVDIINKYKNDVLEVKAAGGIKTYEDAMKYIEKGVTRIGTRHGVEIMEGELKMTLFEELKWRGLIDNITDPELEEKINKGGLTFYIGTDPTGDSLHIGHYSTFSIAFRLKEAGHHPILLVGGGTGLIGDPKPSAERPMITKEELDSNYKKLRKQVEDIFGFEVVNNYDWMKDINFIDYLRDYGKYFNLNYMLNKETVKSRLDIGITYTEFSYMILQSLDFLHLHENRNCTLQVGGSDQWGNITSGVELVRKKTGDVVYGLTMPLITKADGTKFGKSEGKAIWLDKNKTTSYEMYQFFLNSEDSKVIEYLKMLTFLSVDEIKELEKKHLEHPEYREAHKALARSVITFLHGEEEYEKAVKMSEALFSDQIFTLKADDIISNFKDVPTFTFKQGLLLDILVLNNICSSKREAREMITSNAISVNNIKVTDVENVLGKDSCVEEKVVIIRKGKRNIIWEFMRTREESLVFV